jgi:hypothetical protein
MEIHCCMHSLDDVAHLRSSALAFGRNSITLAVVCLCVSSLMQNTTATCDVSIIYRSTAATSAGGGEVLAF